MIHNVQKFCPVCGKLLNLRQINFTTAVYICEDGYCTYPDGFGWLMIQRNLNEMMKDHKIAVTTKENAVSGQLSNTSNLPGATILNAKDVTAPCPREAMEAIATEDYPSSIAVSNSDVVDGGSTSIQRLTDTPISLLTTTTVSNSEDFKFSIDAELEPYMTAGSNSWGIDDFDSILDSLIS